MERVVYYKRIVDDQTSTERTGRFNHSPLLINNGHFPIMFFFICEKILFIETNNLKHRSLLNIACRKC